MKIELDQTLSSRVQQYVRATGYSSAEEFVRHAIERELSKTEPAEASDAAGHKLRGIGYLDAGRDI